MLAVTFIHDSGAESIREALDHCGLNAQNAQPLKNPLTWVVPVPIGQYHEAMKRLNRHFIVESAQVF